MMNCNIPIFKYFDFQPSWKSAQSWLLRYGLYKLTKAKERASDWIVILDFKVQAGMQKCLIVLGLRFSNLVLKQQERKSLEVRHEDFEPLAIVPMNSSNGEKVAQVLEEVSLKTGCFMQIVGDHGGDINKGIKLYCSNHKETVNTYDIVHKLALLLKKELESDGLWEEIIKLITNTKQVTKQSTEACLSPPRQREKARFMNADILIDWLQEALFFLYKGQDFPYLDKNQLINKIGWVLKYSDQIEEYVEMIVIVRLARHQIRVKGLHKRSHIDFFQTLKDEFLDFFQNRKKQEFKDFQLHKKSFNIAKEIFYFLKQEGLLIPEGQTMLGSSESIESVIGREKVIVERTKATKSLTKGVLAIAAMVGENNAEEVEKALQVVSVKDLKEWEDTWIGKSDLAKRKEVFNDNLVLKPLSLQSVIAA